MPGGLVSVDPLRYYCKCGEPVGQFTPYIPSVNIRFNFPKTFAGTLVFLGILGVIGIVLRQRSRITRSRVPARMPSTVTAFSGSGGVK